MNLHRKASFAKATEPKGAKGAEKRPSWGRAARWRRSLATSRSPPDSRDEKPVSPGDRKITLSSTIIIPTHNGKPMLERCLAALQLAVAAAGESHTILVVDDASTDGTPDYLAHAFPSVKVLPLQKCGFARAVNSGVMQADSEAVVLLNNDVVMEPGCLKALLEALQEPEVFAVGAKFLSGEGGLEYVLGNRTRGVWKQGLLEILHETDPARLTVRAPQLYAQGSAVACRRKQFLDLGGFDTLYEPFYWEDVDLSYRAWKRGWKVLYEPNAVCRHFQSQTTERDYHGRYLQWISLRNAYLFHWKNLTDKRLLARHLALIPARAAGDILVGGRSEYSAFIAALRRLREAAARRVVERSFVVISDREVLRRTNGS